MVRVLWGNGIPLPPFYLNFNPLFASTFPHFNLSWPHFYRKLTSASSGILSRGLETTVYRLMVGVFWQVFLRGSTHGRAFRGHLNMKLSGQTHRNTSGEKLKYHPFWGSPLVYKTPPRQFQPPKCKLTPSKIQIGRGQISVYFETKTADWRSPIPFWRVSIYILEAANLHFGGCQLSWGGFIEKGWSPKRVVFWFSANFVSDSACPRVPLR